VDGRFKAGAEAFLTSPSSSDGQTNAGFNAGGKWLLAPGRVLMFSAGRSFRNEPELTLFVGLKLLFLP